MARGECSFCTYPGRAQGRGRGELCSERGEHERAFADASAICSEHSDDGVDLGDRSDKSSSLVTLELKLDRVRVHVQAPLRDPSLSSPW